MPCSRLQECLKAREQQREANIKAREGKRLQKEEEDRQKNQGKGKQSSKYAKSDILMLKSIFDMYDDDGSGTVGIKELRKALNNQREQNSRNDGTPKTLAQRNADKVYAIKYDNLSPGFCCASHGWPLLTRDCLVVFV